MRHVFLSTAKRGEELVGRGDLGSGNAEPAGLDVHHADQGKIVLVVEDGGAGELLEALGAGDVVDVGVSDEDLLEGELVLLEQGEDAGDVVAGIDDDGLAGDLVSEDGAVALERADGEDFVARVRGQKKFDSVKELVTAMGKDTDQARSLLAE